LKDKLAAYKLPRNVLQMEALPRNATGKILKTKLREIAAEKFAR
jgi:acyl-coenzyme A synthetase/AMP-(fatty) acid ligase